VIPRGVTYIKNWTSREIHHKINAFLEFILASQYLPIERIPVCETNIELLILLSLLLLLIAIGARWENDEKKLYIIIIIIIHNHKSGN